jgi:DNA invertase Pin-like site-specific DNA recombinase
MFDEELTREINEIAEDKIANRLSANQVVEKQLVTIVGDYNREVERGKQLLPKKFIKRVVLYARVSTRDKGQDTENQLVQLRAYCVRQDWEIVYEYIDYATGKNSDRDMFKKMFQDAYQGKFELVLFWSLDRFSREGVLETLQHLQKLTSYKVDWKSYTEQYLDSCGVFREAVLAILATIAKQERIRIVERTVAGIERARSKGKIIGRPKTDCDINSLVKMREAGLSFRYIAEVKGIDKNVVMRRLQEHDKANPKEIKTENSEEIIIETFQEDN